MEQELLGSNRLALFGTRQQTIVLLVLALLEESYPRELSRITSASLKSVQNLVDKLELQGVLATRLIGKERRVSFSPRFFAHRPLRDLLLRLAEVEPEVQKMAASVRRRPRRRGKPL